MRKTKIICTLGPAVDSDDMIRRLIEAGMDCARFNFSHGTHEEQKVRMDRVRDISRKMNAVIPLLLDTKGPEIRLKNFKDGYVILKNEQLFTLDTDKNTPGDDTRIGLTYDGLAKAVQEGTVILIDDGKIELKVTAIQDTSVVCRVVNGGKVSNHKSINIPNVAIPMPYISEADKEDLLFGISENVEFVAASFVRTGDDVRQLRKFLNDNGGNSIRIISKIESSQGVDNLDDIIDLSDGIMVARGDLGVEIPYQKIPALQKYMIDQCNRKGRIVVTATQMLESMTENPRPTRAEISDVANAVYDGTTAIMLSGESAAGRFPTEAVRTMSDIAVCTEESIDYNTSFVIDDKIMEHNIKTAICASAYNAARYLDAKAIVVMTRSGETARYLSYFHPSSPIIAATIDNAGLHQLNLVWNVMPIPACNLDSTDGFVEYAVDRARESRLVKDGDKIIVICASSLNSDNDIMRICTV